MKAQNVKPFCAIHDMVLYVDCYALPSSVSERSESLISSLFIRRSTHLYSSYQPLQGKGAVMSSTTQLCEPILLHKILDSHCDLSHIKFAGKKLIFFIESVLSPPKPTSNTFANILFSLPGRGFCGNEQDVLHGERSGSPAPPVRDIGQYFRPFSGLQA